MKRYTILLLIFSVVGMVVAGILLTVLLSQPRKSESSVPEFVMPTHRTEYADEITEHTTVTTTSATATVSVTRASHSESPESVAEPDIITAESPSLPEKSDISTNNLQTDVPSAQSVTSITPDLASSASVVTSSTPTETVASTVDSTSVTADVTTSQTVSDEELTSSNVLVSSGDPLHHIRFEFGEKLIHFSGVYSGEPISEVEILRKSIRSLDLSSNGSSFYGSLNVSSLDPGFYIIRVKPGNGIMDYVFQMTNDGASPLSWDDLPADENLSAAASPLELSEEGVIQYITSTGDRQTVQQILDRVKKLSDEICSGLPSDYDKLRAISEWVSRNMYYDKDASENGVTEEMLTLEYILEYHRSVCFGWTNLFSALCQAQGIWCANASGSVVTGSRCFMQTAAADERSHSWNMAVIDGRQIWVDTVWNSSNSYAKQRYSAGPQDLQYFDISTAALSQDHRVTRFEYRDYFAI